MGRHGGMLQVHCEDPVLLDAAVSAALQRGDVSPRYHATTRPSYVEAVATARALAFARMADAPVHVVHLSSAAALDEVRRAKAAGVRVTAETCPHYLVLTEERYDDPDPVVVRPLSSSRRRCARRPTATRCGPAWPTARSTSSRPTTSPTAWRSRRPRPRNGVPFDKISNGAPGIETLLTIVYSEGVAKGRLTVERMVDLLATTPARRFGLATKGALEVGRDADIVLFDPAARRTIRAADLHHTSDYTPYEGLEARPGAVRSVFVRGRPASSIRDGAFVGPPRLAREPSIERGCRSRHRLTPAAQPSIEQSDTPAASGTRRSRRRAPAGRAAPPPPPAAPRPAPPSRASSSSRIVAYSAASNTRPSASATPRVRQCHSWEREISAVAASSIRLSIAAAPTPRSHESRYASATRMFARIPASVTAPPGTRRSSSSAGADRHLLAQPILLVRPVAEHAVEDLARDRHEVGMGDPRAVEPVAGFALLVVADLGRARPR